MTVFYILLAVLLFGILILSHEFGHFITAKLSGIRVNEFSLFMGPAIWKRTKGETTYSLRCIPFGGYCAMEGEDGDSDDPRSFTRAKVWKRLIVLVAGAAMNFILGFLIVVILIASAYDYLPTREITFIEDDRPFAEVLQVGDEFYSINGERVYVRDDITMLLSREADGVHDLVILRDGEKLELKDVTIRCDFVDESSGSVRYGFSTGTEEPGFRSVLSYSWNETINFARLVRLSLVDLFRGAVSVKDMSGPVGIVDTVAQVGTQSETVGFGILNILYLFAFISVNLAVMNLLPIPALDGGRVLCLLVTWGAEKLLRRKIDPKYEGYLHAGFMILLLALMALITFKDVLNIFS